jgi:two-component system response regulator PhoP
MRILIVEDEPRIRQSLKLLFENNGYTVDLAADGEEGLYFGEEYPIDLAIIDLGLPRMDGVTLISSLRQKHKNFPIIVVTARNEWQEKVRGLEAGADDYVTKPFIAEELLARVEAMLRRAQGFSKEHIEVGPISVDTLAEEVSVSGIRVDLTAYEYKLLVYFLQNSNKPISKITLTEHLYAQDFERDSNVIEVLVGRLRRKLDPDNKHNLIETLRGRGYRLNTEMENA